MPRIRWTLFAGPALIVAGLAPLLIGSGLAAAAGRAVRNDPRLTSSAAVTVTVTVVSLLFVVAYGAGRRRWKGDDETLDAVTGLPNRHVLWEAADDAADGAQIDQPAALVVIELDRLAEVNLMFGMDCGDAVMAALSARIRDAAEPADLVARIGGDEFGVLRARCGGHLELQDLTDAIVAAVTAPLSVEGFELEMGARLGAALTGPETPDGATLRAHAELARYRASRSPSGTVEVWSSNAGEVISPALLTSWVNDALHGEQFALHHQQICQLDSLDIVGTEGLLRWAHPDQGLLVPSAVLPGLEDTGHIVAVGEWAIAEACRQIAEWDATRPDDPIPQVFLNISVRQLLHRSFIGTVEDALAAHGLHGHRLVFELGRLGELTPTSGAWSVLRECRALGVRLALDNFGYAGSSFALLDRLPLDYVKLDRHLTTARGAGPRDDALARSLIALASELGAAIVAEGVEDDATLQRVRRLGCTLGQGYHLGVPVAGHDLARSHRSVDHENLAGRESALHA